MRKNVFATCDDIMLYATTVVQSFTKHSWNAFIACDTSRRSASLATRKLSVGSICLKASSGASWISTSGKIIENLSLIVWDPMHCAFMVLSIARFSHHQIVDSLLWTIRTGRIITNMIGFVPRKFFLFDISTV